MTQYIVPLKFVSKAAADALADDVALTDGYEEEILNPNYDPTNPDAAPERIPNPQTKLEFAMGRVVGFLQSKKQAADAIRAAANTPTTPPDIGVIT